MAGADWNPTKPSAPSTLRSRGHVPAMICLPDLTGLQLGIATQGHPKSQRETGASRTARVLRVSTFMQHKEIPL